MIALVLDFGLFWWITGRPGLAAGFIGVGLVVKTTGFYLWRLSRG